MNLQVAWIISVSGELVAYSSRSPSRAANETVSQGAISRNTIWLLTFWNAAERLQKIRSLTILSLGLVKHIK